MGADGSGPGKPDEVMRSMTSSGNGGGQGGRGMRLAGRLRTDALIMTATSAESVQGTAVGMTAGKRA